MDACGASPRRVRCARPTRRHIYISTGHWSAINFTSSCCHSVMVHRMFNRHTIIAICTLAVVAASNLHAQEPIFVPTLEGLAIGAYGGIVAGKIDAEFNIDRNGLSESTSCGRYERGSLGGFVAGVLTKLPLTMTFGFV